MIHYARLIVILFLGLIFIVLFGSLPFIRATSHIMRSSQTAQTVVLFVTIHPGYTGLFKIKNQTILNIKMLSI